MNFKKLFLLPALSLVASTVHGAPLFYKSTTAANSWTGSVWGTAAGGPYTDAWVSGSDVVFEDNGGTALALTGATTQFASITANESVTLTASGTLGTNGTVATINVASGKNLNFAGQAVSTAAGTGFNKTGPGIWTTAGNTFAGGFTLTDGTLAAGGVNAMGAGGVLNLNGGTLRSNSATARDFTGKFTGGINIGANITLGDTTNTGALTFSNNVALGGTTRTLTVNSAINMSGIVSGAAGTGLSKAGPGTLTLSGANTFDGGLSISGGTVSIAAAANIGPGPLAHTAANTTLNITGTAVTLANNISLAAGGRTTIATPNTSATIISGVVSGGDALTEWFFQGGASGQNTGVLTLTNANTMQGTINIQRGPLVLGNAAAAGSAVIKLDSNNNASGSLQIGGNFTIPNDIIMQTVTQRIGVATGLTGVLSGVISSAGGTSGFEKVGAGTLTLASTANTYTGPTNVSAGTLAITSGNNLGAGSLVHTAVNTTLSVLGTSAVISNNITLASGGRTTIVTPNNSSTVVNGVVSGGNAATEWFFQGGVAGQNTGALTLTNANTFLGTLNVQRGPLILGNAAAASSAVIKLDSNNHPDGALQIGGNFTVPNNVTLQFFAASPIQRIGVGAGLDATLSGVISSAGGNSGFEKVGAGTLRLTGINTFTNTAVVTSGKLAIMGSIAGAAQVDGGVLAGTGAIGGLTTVNAAGTLAPGSSPGILTTVGLTINGGTMLMELNGSAIAGTDYDQVQVNGAIDLTGGGTLTLAEGYLPSLNDTVFLALNDGTDAVTGTFTSLPEGSLIPSTGGSWQISYLANGDLGTVGNDIALTFIPEPSSAAALALAGLALLARRRR